MIQCKLLLYILIFNKISLQYEIVSLSDTKIIVPNKEIIPSDQIMDMVKSVFETHVELSSHFVTFILSDVQIEQEILEINYYCLVPYSTSITNSYLIPINTNEIYSEHLRKIFNHL